MYLYCAVDSNGNFIYIYLSKEKNYKVAK
ncbi:TPA: hypothetical protein QCN67_005538 [Bacillus thuringiensis]|nr:hypothetical protein [Bacillus thuringiensis]RUR59419.1 hypothetical protein ELS81_30030 [Bacillus sp. VKPM B-3276]RNG26428.1 hypothetical protein EEL55_27695 [Bacillus thuringiensis]UEL01267.1 hypothetical protein K8Z23_30010 [Bacillus thuringiensis]HDR3452151.1 hypothetical protein [Bacillus thuringiensis]